MQNAAVQAKTDEELVKLFQSGGGREGAFMALFDRYGAMTHAFLRRRIGNADVAAEINQDLYIGVLEGLDRFRGDSSFKTWLFRMAQNRLSNLRRRWRTHLDELPDSSPDELMEEIVTSGAELPDEQAVREEQGRSLEKCLAGLPEIERAVVVGQYYEGVTLEELTRRFKMTNKSGARASLIAAQRKLRRCLQKAGIHDSSIGADSVNGRMS
ncbi:MAG: RNA polymerase sigma factor [bacterium]|nr:RNA polymerase sigma factor [bacterium]